MRGSEVWVYRGSRVRSPPVPVVLSVYQRGSLLVVVVVVVTFFNHNFVNCKATLILAIKIYETKYNISLNDIHT